jgi:hypothetical protein
MLFERFGKSRRRLIANPGRNPGYGVVAGFEHQCGLVHPSRDEVTVHGMADEPGKASREGRSAEPHMATQRAKGPRVFGVFVVSRRGGRVEQSSCRRQRRAIGPSLVSFSHSL